MVSGSIWTCDGTNGIPREDCPNYGRVELELRLGIHRRYHRHHEGKLWEPLGGSTASVGTTASIPIEAKKREVFICLQGSEVLGISSINCRNRSSVWALLDRIRAWPKPISRDELRACLGLFPFLSMFSPCTSSILRPCLERSGVCRIGLPYMMSVWKHQSYSSRDKS